jgi:hypothetical protein
MSNTTYTRRHMCININGLLRQYGTPGKKGYKSMSGLLEEDGRKLSDQECRIYLHNCQVKGWKVIPCSGECEGFDYFGHGCPGHPITKEEYETKNEPCEPTEL